LDGLERQLARLTVVTDPPAAEVNVDAVSMGLSPTDPLWLTAGSHKVELHKIGHRSLEALVDIPAGGEQKLEQTLPLEAGVAPGEKPRRTWLWAGMGAAGAVAVVAIVVGVTVNALRPPGFAATLDPLDRRP
jgi:hypothetical protein